MSKYPEIVTDRLILRGFRDDDAPVIRDLAGAREVAEMTLNIPHPYLDGMAEIWMSSHEEEYESGMGIVFAIIQKSTDYLIGAVGLTVSKRFARAELGYWIGKSYWGQGYATEAARALVKYGFEEMKLNKISATHMTRNPASGKVMMKIGMEQEGILKQHALKWDQFVDLAAYGLLAETWRKDQAS